MTTPTLAFSKYAYGTTAALYAIGNVDAGESDEVIVDAVPREKIRVLACAFVCGDTGTDATFQSDSTPISPIFQNASNSGAVLPHNPVGWFETSAGEALTLTTGSGSTTGVLVVYVVV